jgi:maltose/moltooligosaccharide transporter
MDAIKAGLAINPTDLTLKNQLKLSEDLGDWVGILFGIYNGISAIFAFFIPMIAKKLGRSKTHALALLMGGLGLILMYFMPNKTAMILPMLFIGIAWASILAMPYAMLAGAIPSERMGVFMGVFNFFITLPQIFSALFSGPIVKHLFGGNAAYALVMGGVFMLLAFIFTLRIKIK